MSDILVEDLGDGRVSIPLMMIDGNMDLLLNGGIECEGVELVRYGAWWCRFTFFNER